MIITEWNVDLFYYTLTATDCWFNTAPRAVKEEQNKYLSIQVWRVYKNEEHSFYTYIPSRPSVRYSDQ